MPSSPVSNPDRAELSESKFRAYEANLREFLATFPEPYRCVPARGSLSSLVVRLREAANAVRHNSHKFTAPISFSVDEFSSAWSKVKVSIRGDAVVIAEPSRLVEISRSAIAENGSTKSFFTISNPTLSELSTFANVCLRRGISEPFLFVGEVPAFTPPLGVAFEQMPEGWLML
jgi:hypothetical protein